MRRVCLLSIALLTISAVAAGCGEEETYDPFAEPWVQDETPPRRGLETIPDEQGWAPGTNAGAGGDEGSVADDAGTLTDPGAEDPNPGGSPPETPVEFRELGVPLDGVDARTDHVGTEPWIFDRPLPDCSGRSGTMVAAVPYQLVNPDTADVEVRVALRTAENGVSLTLPSGSLFAFGPGALDAGVATCARVGAVTDVFSGELEGLIVPGSGFLEVVVAADASDANGSYQLTVSRVYDESPPTSGGFGSPGDDGRSSGTPGSGADSSDDRPSSDPVPDGYLCEDVCAFSFDGQCDDGGPSSDFAVCAFGSDCTDCGPRNPADDPHPGPGSDSGTCSDTCLFAFDGECDDGGRDAAFAICALGSDCTDCGPR